MIELKSTFNPARAAATAQRLRDGTPAVPLVVRDIKKPGKGGVHVITNIGKASQ